MWGLEEAPTEGRAALPPSKGAPLRGGAGPGPSLFLGKDSSSQELEAVLSQVLSEELVVVRTCKVMDEAVSKHNVKAKNGRRLGWFHSLKKGMGFSMGASGWTTGDFESCKSMTEVVIWWSEVSQVRVD